LYEDDGAEVTILPGMVASIDVLSGKRTDFGIFLATNCKNKRSCAAGLICPKNHTCLILEVMLLMPLFSKIKQS
jgi:hypothetical protein